MWSPSTLGVKRDSRYARRCPSVDSRLMDLKRFSIVPVDSSAARIPLPRATIAFATLASSLMVRLLFETNGEERRVRARLDSTARALAGQRVHRLASVPESPRRTDGLPHALVAALR